MCFVTDAADDVADVVTSVVDTVEDAASSVADAFGSAASSVGHALGSVVHSIGRAAADGASALEHGVEDAVKGIGHAAVDVGHFVEDHAGTILKGIEMGGAAILGATGVGAPLAAAITAGITTGTEIAEGKNAGDAILDGVTGAADKLVPGLGSATHTVVTGVEHGDSLSTIVHNAGADGLGFAGGPLADAAKVGDDVISGRPLGQIALDVGTHIANGAVGVGTDHNSFVGQVGIIGVNDAVEGKSIGQFGLDVGKAYVDNAGGGTPSPTVNAVHTVLDDVGAGKSFGDIVNDVVNQGIQEGGRVDTVVPGAVSGVVQSSGLPASHYVGTFLGDIADGKSAHDALGDAAKQAGADFGHKVADATGLGGLVGGGDNGASHTSQPLTSSDAGFSGHITDAAFTHVGAATAISPDVVASISHPDSVDDSVGLSPNHLLSATQIHLDVPLMANLDTDGSGGLSPDIGSGKDGLFNPVFNVEPSPALAQTHLNATVFAGATHLDTDGSGGLGPDVGSGKDGFFNPVYNVEPSPALAQTHLNASVVAGTAYVDPDGSGGLGQDTPHVGGGFWDHAAATIDIQGHPLVAADLSSVITVPATTGMGIPHEPSPHWSDNLPLAPHLDTSHLDQAATHVDVGVLAHAELAHLPIHDMSHAAFAHA